jgi:hypothetical protein
MKKIGLILVLLILISIVSVSALGPMLVKDPYSLQVGSSHSKYTTNAYSSDQLSAVLTPSMATFLTELGPINNSTQNGTIDSLGAIYLPSDVPSTDKTSPIVFADNSLYTNPASDGKNIPHRVG